MKVVSLVLFLTLCGASRLSGQTTGAATIVGTVTDSSGAVVPGAKVIVVNIHSNLIANPV